MCRSKGDAKIFKQYCLCKCEGNIGEGEAKEAKSCNEVKTVIELTYQ